VLKRNKPLTRRRPMGRGTRQPRSRDEAGEAERRLWTVLADREVAGLRFRQRELIGPYLVPFHCPAARLVILIQTDEAPDEEQISWLRTGGYRVLTFPAREVLADPNAVVEAVERSFELRIVPRSN
jgi:very-short-patch-repair endonuclease